MTNPVSSDASTRRQTFFRVLFRDYEGYICLAIRTPGTRSFSEYFFKYPQELPAALEFVDQRITNFDIYYCPHLFDTRKRSKETVSTVPALWGDLDDCPPENLLVKPSVAIESSTKRYQALWILQEPIDPATGEDLSRRIAYYHADEGSDISGWDLTQLLRVPYTYNFKYKGQTLQLPVVEIISTGQADFTEDSFACYPEAKGFEYSEIPFPENLNYNDADTLLEEFRTHLPSQVAILYNETPRQDWSKALWSLQLLLAEAGMSREQMFVVTSAAACNKYKRDGRSDKLLWRECCKAFSRNEQKDQGKPEGQLQFELKPLLTDEERLEVRNNPSVIEEYINWAKTVGDAAWQYHQAGAFIILSGLLAGRVRLPTSYGVVVPNIWFMILADTTLTRKTTAMDLAMDILVELDSDCMLATDGSIEGLMTSLSMRPGRPSVFLRDEFSGLLESLTKKDYYAGMMETLTKLYDGKFQKRVLRKETIEVREPVLVFFAGGIKTRILELLKVEHVMSGFLPRFAIITAESDVTTLRPLGPPTNITSEKRSDIIDKFRDLHRHYVRDEIVNLDGNNVSMPKRWEAELTPAAWQRYNLYETNLLNESLESLQRDMVTPTFDRLCKTGLKVAVLLGATRKQDNKVVVEEMDIIRAFYYVEQWREHAVQVLHNIGKTANERQVEAVLRSIKRQPGITRSAVMQSLHLNARDAEWILLTLEQRGVISRIKQGRTEKLHVVG